MKYDLFAKAYLSMLNESMEYLSEDMLMEDRIDYLKQNTKPINSSHDRFAVHRNTHDIIDFLANNADPSRNKVYTQHLIKMYHNGAFRQEDAPRVMEALHNFDRYKQRLQPDQKDIKKYSSVADIENVVAPLLGTGATKAEQLSIEHKRLKNNLHIPGKHELTYDDNNISIYHLKDKETAQKLYAQKDANKPGVYPCSWCTSYAPPKTENAFDQHVERGNLFVVHRKSDGAVFQFHPSTDQFRDKDNKEISKEDFQSMQDSLEKAWRENPSMVKT